MTNKSEQVTIFLEDLEMKDPEKALIIHTLRDMVYRLVPNSNEKMMYGGILFSNGERYFCGLFARKKHVTVEFDRGNELNDEYGWLEGSGKVRRHLKIQTAEDMDRKQVADYINQSHHL